MWIIAGVCVSQINVNTDVDHIPLGLKPMPYTSVDLAERYLSVHQRKLQAFINIQAVRILQLDSADTGSTGQEESLHGQLKMLPENLARH